MLASGFGDTRVVQRSLPIIVSLGTELAQYLRRHLLMTGASK